MAEESSSVGAVKSSLSEQLGLGVPQVRLLIFRENQEIVLSDSHRLSFYGISEDSHLILDLIRQDCEESIESKPVSRPSPHSPPSKDWLGQLIEKIQQGSLSGVLRILAEFENQEGTDEEDSILSLSDQNGWAPLHFACHANHPNMVQTFLSKEANCNIETLDCWTPLIICCHYGYIECARALMKSPNLQIDRMTETRGTALHTAVRRSQIGLVCFLLDYGACMTLADQSGFIPLELATTHEILEIIPKYMGDLAIKTLNEGASFVDDSTHTGKVFFTSNLMLHDRPVFMVLEPTQGVLEVFKDKHMKDVLQHIKLIDIYAVHSIKTPKFGPSLAHAFTVASRSGQFNFYTLDLEATDHWIYRIKESVKYAQKNKLGMSLMPIRDSFPVEMCSIEDMDMRTSIIEDSKSELVNFKSFTILEELGCGSFGKVYKVVKNDTNKVYALKALNRQFLLQHRQLKYAIGECKVLRYLRHPFIITMEYAFQTPKNLYMVLEYCPNGDLMAHLSERSRFTENVSKFYIAETILAIEYLHSLDIVYRDLKPENLLLDRGGHIRLADFGLAKEDVSPVNLAMSFCGSPAYLAPELLGKAGSDKSADIYGLGAILYELLTGLPPYYSDNIKELFKNIRRGGLTFPKFVSPEAQDIIRKMMEKDPKKRPSINRVKSHVFFCNIDWEMLEAKKVKPPRLGSRWVQMDEYPEHEYVDVTNKTNIVEDEDYAETDDFNDVIAEFSFTR